MVSCPANSSIAHWASNSAPGWISPAASARSSRLTKSSPGARRRCGTALRSSRSSPAGWCARAVPDRARACGAPMKAARSSDQAMKSPRSAAGMPISIAITSAGSGRASACMKSKPAFGVHRDRASRSTRRSMAGNELPQHVAAKAGVEHAADARVVRRVDEQHRAREKLLEVLQLAARRRGFASPSRRCAGPRNARHRAAPPPRRRDGSAATRRRRTLRSSGSARPRAARRRSG